MPVLPYHGYRDTSMIRLRVTHLTYLPPKDPLPLSSEAGEGRPEPCTGAFQCGISHVSPDVLSALKPAGGGNRAPPRREGVGETRFPHMFTSDGYAHGAQRQNENSIVLGRAPPSQTLSASRSFPGRASSSQTLPRASYVHLKTWESRTLAATEAYHSRILSRS